MTNTARGAPIANRLLDQLPAKDRAHVLAACEEVDLAFGEVVAAPGDPIRHVYFPTGAFISLATPMGGRDSLEVAIIGNEGLYGVPVALGVAVSPVHALVQGGGSAQRMAAGAFRRELARLPALRNCIDRYVYVLMSQVSQAAGCNRFHVVEQRVARWLLTTGDRAHSSSFQITHELLADILGVRRVGITEAAGALQDRKLIGYSRGKMTIRDRNGLERASCGCYRSDISTYDRVLS